MKNIKTDKKRKIDQINPHHCPCHNNGHPDAHFYQEEILGNLQISAQIARRTREIATPGSSYGCDIKTEIGLTH